MTMRETWLRFVSACCRPEPGPTLDDRIAKQVQWLIHDLVLDNDILDNLATDVSALKKRSENVDAFYVKTVTQALSERQDKIAHSLECRINAIDENHKFFVSNIHSDIANMSRALHDELEANLQRSMALESRLAALVSKLRAGLE